jgi:hypothetical protein
MLFLLGLFLILIFTCIIIIYTTCKNIIPQTHLKKYESNKRSISRNNAFGSRDTIITPTIINPITTFIPKTSMEVNIWPTIVRTVPFNISFPEQCKNTAELFNFKIPDINKVSIAISGGGPRTFTCMIGYFRALNRMGYKNKAQYSSTVSGGSWFYGLHSYCQSNPSFTDEVLLGSSCGLNIDSIPEPENLTMNSLNITNNYNLFFGKRLVDESMVSNMISALRDPNIPTDMVWNYVIGKMFLEPYGLNQEVPIALNSKHKDNLISRNIFSKDIPALTLPDNLPFWLCNTTLLFNYASEYPSIVTSMTPLYSGITQPITMNNITIGGIVVDNAVFGNIDPPANQKLSLNNNRCDMVYNIYNKTKLRTLRDMIGSSSTFYATLLYNAENISPVLSALLPSSSVNLIPGYKIWGNFSPLGTISDAQCDYKFSTGKCVVPNGYDAKSCARFGLECYSISAPQCTSDNQCGFLYSKGQCRSRTDAISSWNCKSNRSLWNPTACKCNTKQTKYTQLTTQNLSSQQSRMSDGVFADNTGIVALVARGVRRIIAFVNTVIPIPTYSPELCEIDTRPLFGIPNNEDCTKPFLGTPFSQVFKSSDYEKVVNQFKTNFNNGGPVFARELLDVLPNSLNGVVGGYKVDLLIVLLQTSSKFINNLPEEIRSEITYDVPVYSRKSFNNFPYFGTSFQNITGGPIQYSLKQVNLLSTYTDWYLNQEPLKSHVQKMFS